jgi:hypothetical protein
VISGKDFFTSLNRQLGEQYHISVPVNTVSASIKSDEVDPEIIEIIKKFVSPIKAAL